MENNEKNNRKITATDERFRLLWYLSRDPKSISTFFPVKHLYAHQLENLLQAVMKRKLSLCQ